MLAVGEPLAVHKGLEIFESWAQAGIEPRKRFGRGIKQPCPKCGPDRNNPRDPSLLVNANGDQGDWTCFNDGCGWKGKIDDKSWQPGMPRSNETSRNEKVWTKPDPAKVLNADAAEEAVVRAFFAKRKIPWEVVEEAKIGWGMVNMPQFDKKVQTVQFPYYRDGKLVNVKYRGPRPVDKDGKTRTQSKTFSMVKDAERIWYGLDWCKDERQIYIVEGEMDALAIRALGLPVLSCPNGAPSLDAQDVNKHLSYVASGTEVFEAADTIVLAGDMGETGQRFMAELARRIGKNKCWRVRWPDGIKDANDMLMAHGLDGLQAQLSQMEPWPVEGIVMPMDLWAEVEDYWENGLDPGFTCSWAGVSQLMRPAVGQTMTVTGIPTHGKSSFIEAYLVDLAMRHGIVAGLCSPEHWPPQKCLTRLCSIYLDKPVRDEINEATGEVTRKGMTREELRGAMAWVQEHFRLIMPSLLSIGEIFERARLLAMRDGIQVMAIDPWTSLKHDQGNKREDQYIADVLADGRELARNHGFLLIWSAHPSKQLPLDQSSGEMPIVGPYQIKGGTAWADFNDFVLTIHRRVLQDGSPTTVRVWKVRFEDNGMPGTAMLGHDRKTGRYWDVAGEIELGKQYQAASRKSTMAYERVGGPGDSGPRGGSRNGIGPSSYAGPVRHEREEPVDA